MNYRGFSLEELALEYSPRATVGGDIAHYEDAYRALSARARSRLKARTDLTYGDKPRQILDFFPSQMRNPPLHVFIHGGYWQALDHRASAAMAPGIVAGGAAFAALSHTLAPEARISDMVDECRDALDWLASNSGTLGFDPSRVTVSGHSAGAHLAAMTLSLHGDRFGTSGLRVTDAILISGVYDLEPVALAPANEPLRLTATEIAELSPITRVTPESVRVRVTVADGDTGEFIRQSRDYAERLRKSGRQVSFDLQKGRHHFDIILHPDTFRSGPANSHA